MDRLPIVTDTETDDRAFREILTLARMEGLTTYDAAYLELATRRGLAIGDTGQDAHPGGPSPTGRDVTGVEAHRGFGRYCAERFP